MKRRLAEIYTVMMLRPERQPLVLQMRPVMFWLVASSFAIALLVAFWAGWHQGRSSVGELKRISHADFQPSCQEPM